jgi:hypothetical protein
MLKYFLSFFVVFLVGCATLEESKQQDSFDVAANAYKQSILFGKYQVANGFRKAPLSDQEPLDLRRLKKIRVTSYELTAVNVSQDRLLVYQTVEISYYNIDNMLERTLTDKQLWKYDTEAKTWHIHSDLPDFQ